VCCGKIKPGCLNTGSQFVFLLVLAKIVGFRLTDNSNIDSQLSLQPEIQSSVGSGAALVPIKITIMAKLVGSGHNYVIDLCS
jgi:hypothetical protein